MKNIMKKTQHFPLDPNYDQIFLKIYSVVTQNQKRVFYRIRGSNHLHKLFFLLQPIVQLLLSFSLQTAISEYYNVLFLLLHYYNLWPRPSFVGLYSNEVLFKQSLCCTTENDRNENGHLLKLYSHCIFITPWCKIYFSHFIHLDPYFPCINSIFLPNKIRCKKHITLCNKF